ncbi:hypothetical protein SAMN05216503_0230 [Polaribacter sp. KT25b]|uniref:tetratricopeptide repeat protein n=1 Tax=Polaribacter sp. KT25b TaxID=1855336 RepID=UPI00087AAD03|nr:hypothetical protein [Polaribacter sp. KT25b]SDR67021.1 hypothetical protein SAMN05216503_0230 [Polaribacter sp. KT25b]
MSALKIDDYLFQVLNFYFQEKEDLNIRSQKIALISGLNLSFIKNYSKCKEDYLSQLILRNDEDISMHATIGLFLGVLCNKAKESSILSSLVQIKRIQNTILEMLNYLIVQLKTGYQTERAPMLLKHFNDHFKWFLPDVIDDEYFSISIPFNNIKFCCYGENFYNEGVVNTKNIKIDSDLKYIFSLTNKKIINNSKKSKGVYFYLDQLFTATLNHNKIENIGLVLKEKIISNVFNFTVELQKTIKSSYFSGIILMGKNKSELALNDLKNDKYINNSNKISHIIKCYNDLNRYEEAIAFSLENEKIEDRIDYYALIGHAYYKNSDYTKAIYYLEFTLQSKFDLLNDDNKSYVFETLGLLYYKVGDLNKSKTLFKGYLEKDNNKSDYALYFMAFLLQKESNYKKAIELYGLLIKRKYREKKCLYDLFECYLALNDFDNIKSTISRIGEIDDCLNDFCVFLYYKKNEDYKNMWLILEDLKIENIEDTKILNDLGIFYNDEFGDSKMARKFFKKAYKLKPNIVVYLENIIQTYFSEMVFIASLKSFEILEEIKPFLIELEKQYGKGDKYSLYKFQYHFYRSVYLNIDEFGIAKSYHKDKEIVATVFGKKITGKSPININQIQNTTVEDLILQFKTGRVIFPFYSKEVLKRIGITKIESFSFTLFISTIFKNFYNEEKIGYVNKIIDENSMISVCEYLRNDSIDKSYIGFLYLLEICFFNSNLIEGQEFIKNNLREVSYLLDNFPSEFSFKIVEGDIPYIDLNENYLKNFKNRMKYSLNSIMR